MGASELSERDEFGIVRCDLPSFEQVWIKFKTRGYPFKLRREWDETRDDRKILEIILRYIEDWNLTDVSGQHIALLGEPRKAEILDSLEDSLVVWLIRAFRRFWQIDLPAARKNSLPPSPVLQPEAAAELLAKSPT